jgi:hypothetical protein
MASDSQSSYFSLPGARIIGICHYVGSMIYFDYRKVAKLLLKDLFKKIVLKDIK